MNVRRCLITVTILLVGSAALSVGGHRWSVAHIQRWSGRHDLGFVDCRHCHLVDTARLGWNQPRPRHPAPAGLAVSPDNTRLFVALDDVGEVAEIDLAAMKVTRRTPVTGKPMGLVVDATGDRLYVTCKEEGVLKALDARTLKEIERVEVGVYPTGLAWSQTKLGERIIVANSGSDDVSVVGTQPLRELGRVATGREPYAVTMAPDGATASIANRLAESRRFDSQPTSELTVIDPARGRVLERHVLTSAHLSEGVAVAPGRNWTLVPLVKVRNLVPITQVANGWVMSSGLAVADRQGVLAQMPLDEANDYFADPSGIAVDHEGRRAYIASGGGDAVTVVNLGRLGSWLDRADPATRAQAIEDLSLSADYIEARIPTGRNPKAVALSPDGRRLIVSERLDDAILVVDTSTLRPLGRVHLGDGGLEDPIRRGERVFTRAAYTFQRQFSCRSCHPDGHVDGLSYDFDGDGIGDNLLDNRTLQGVAGTAPFKWNGKNPSLQVQCGPRFARVLMRTDPIPPTELNDLSAYLHSLPPPRSRPTTSARTAAQERGRKLFFATTTSTGKPIPRERQCQTCHRPPLFTNRLPSAIGTRGPRDTTDLFDTPHLLGVGMSAPYLHDGRAQTLEELWTVYQTNDLHGVSSYMDKHQLNDLVEYLKSL